MIVFRVDSSTKIGSGHLIRSIALANQFRSMGHEILFICRDLIGARWSELDAAGLTYERISAKTWPDDQKQTIHILNSKSSVSLVVFDHYEIDALYEERFFKKFPVFVIDDLANRKHMCDFLLDYSFRSESEKAYQDLVPDHCVKFLGPRHSLLRHEFIASLTKKELSSIAISNPRVLVFFGGTDPTGETLKFTKILFDFENQLSKESLAGNDIVICRQLFINTHWTILLGPGNANKDQFLDLTWTDQIRLMVSTKNMSELMNQHDFYLGSGGTVTWERLYLGLPGVVVSVADNQVFASQALAEQEYQTYLGQAEDVKYDQAIVDLLKLISEPERVRKYVENGQQLVQPFRAQNLRFGISLRKALKTDDLFLFELRNDPSVRDMSVTTAKVEWDQHVTWLNQRLHDASTHLFIAEFNGRPVGQTRIDSDGEISISLISPFRGRGLSTKILLAVIALLQKDKGRVKKISAKVKSNNFVSLHSFRSAGFEEGEIINIENVEYQTFLYSFKDETT